MKGFGVAQFMEKHQISLDRDKSSILYHVCGMQDSSRRMRPLCSPQIQVSILSALETFFAPIVQLVSDAYRQIPVIADWISLQQSSPKRSSNTRGHRGEELCRLNLSRSAISRRSTTSCRLLCHRALSYVRSLIGHPYAHRPDVWRIARETVLLWNYSRADVFPG